MTDFARHIVIATDFSDGADVAVDKGAQLAELTGAKVTLLHSFDPDPLVPPGAIPNASQYREKITQEMSGAVQAKLDEIRQGPLKGVPDVDTVVSTHRSTSTAICKKAKDVNADLIVLSTHGRTGLSHMLIGSVAERVLRHAHCPVLAVRRPKA